jgi:hypothetical protein
LIPVADCVRSSPTSRHVDNVNDATGGQGHRWIAKRPINRRRTETRIVTEGGRKIEEGIDADESIPGGLLPVIVDPEDQVASVAVRKRATGVTEASFAGLVLFVRQPLLEVEFLRFVDPGCQEGGYSLDRPFAERLWYHRCLNFDMFA